MNPTIGIALSGGGIRGMAHLGILQYLYEIGIQPSVISGTSAGSLAGVFLAAGFEPKEIVEIGKAENFFNRSSLELKSGGLFNTHIFERILNKYIPHDDFEKLNIPMYVTATNLVNAELVVFNKGSIATAVKASCAVPLVFKPVHYKDAYLCDGGILNNFPTNLIKGKCDKIIGVNVSNIPKSSIVKWSYKTIIERIVKVSINYNMEDKKQLCDIYMEPPKMEIYSTFDFSKIDEIYKTGYDYAREKNNELISFLD
ncbi:patatin-like phospholipase family protein [Olleya sp.]|jgi:NTE family protein|uniref:patatin-like phospholipase family protein n=1 Tax=Olleya sp. TaxID=1906788 RepID=UPI0032D90693|tara:strand:- start:152 stop:919 length:768 start_codon:yes stop_codon:yes gene_type:complete